MTVVDQLVNDYRERLTREQAERFVRCPTVNPLTGARIKRGKDRFLALERVCREMYGLAPRPATRFLPVPEGHIPPTPLGWCSTWEHLVSSMADEAGNLLDMVTDYVRGLETALLDDPQHVFSQTELLEAADLLRLCAALVGDDAIAPLQAMLDRVLATGYMYQDRPKAPPKDDTVGDRLFEFRLRDSDNVRETGRMGVKYLLMNVGNVHVLRGLVQNIRYLEIPHPDEVAVPFPALLDTARLDWFRGIATDVANLLERFGVFRLADVVAHCRPDLERHQGLHIYQSELLAAQLRVFQIVPWDRVQAEDKAPRLYITTEDDAEGEAECPICYGALERDEKAEDARAVCFHSCGHCICAGCLRRMQATRGISRCPCPQCKQTPKVLSYLDSHPAGV